VCVCATVCVNSQGGKIDINEYANIWSPPKKQEKNTKNETSTVST